MNRSTFSGSAETDSPTDVVYAVDTQIVVASLKDSDAVQVDA
jgi:hypothetical protein